MSERNPYECDGCRHVVDHIAHTTTLRSGRHLDWCHGCYRRSQQRETLTHTTLAAGQAPTCQACGGDELAHEGEGHQPGGTVHYLRCTSCDRLHRVVWETDHAGQGSLL